MPAEGSAKQYIDKQYIDKDIETHSVPRALSGTADNA